MVFERGMTDIIKWDSAMAAASAMVWAVDARIKRFNAKVKQVSRDDYFQRCWTWLLGVLMDGLCSVALRISLGMNE
ncbi:rna-dependent rna polymerase [Aspergillus luchuensis]|uniref:Rna-dependent rna polymerase n=1 Tax=Aspergillus kawachii TaxID=1069201 RepID=A0A146FAC8_ASPKA|nr:rna-dependent rna polymerase [Aspergillus luchuensis]